MKISSTPICARAADPSSCERPFPCGIITPSPATASTCTRACPKYIWLRQHRPEVYGRAWKFVNIKDYLYGRFTGLPGRTDRSDASLCNCLNMHTGDWAWDILREAGVDAGKMPELHASTDVTAR